MAQEFAEPNEFGVGNRSHPHPTRHLAGEGPGFALELLRRGEHSFRLPEQAFAGRGQHHSVRRTLEQRHPQFIFEGLDLRTDRGLADVQSFCGPGQVPGLSDRRKGP